MRTVEFVKWLDDENLARLRFEIERGTVQGFVVQLECLISEEWHRVVRYDTAHGFAHRDLMRPDGETEKTPLTTEDLNEALTLAEDDITANWNQYRRSYMRWLQK